MIRQASVTSQPCEWILVVTFLQGNYSAGENSIYWETVSRGIQGTNSGGLILMTTKWLEVLIFILYLLVTCIQTYFRFASFLMLYLKCTTMAFEIKSHAKIIFLTFSNFQGWWLTVSRHEEWKLCLVTVGFSTVFIFLTGLVTCRSKHMAKY